MILLSDPPGGVRVGGAGGGEGVVIMQAVSVGRELLEVVPVRENNYSPLCD